MRPPIEFVFGGQARTVTATIGLAVKIEDAIGRGVISLSGPLQALEARINDAVTVIRVAMANDGVVYTQEKCLQLCEVEGIVATQLTALRIINGLFAPAAGADAKKAKKTNGATRPLAETNASQ